MVMPGALSVLGKCLGVGEQLVAITAVNTIGSKTTGPGPKAATGAGENTWRAVTVDSYHRAIAIAWSSARREIVGEVDRAEDSSNLDHHSLPRPHASGFGRRRPTFCLQAVS